MDWKQDAIDALDRATNEIATARQLIVDSPDPAPPEPEWEGSIEARTGAGELNGPQENFSDGTRAKWWSKNWRGHAELWYDATRENAKAIWTRPGHILGSVGVNYDGVRVTDIPEDATWSWDAEYDNDNSNKNYNDCLYGFDGWKTSWDDSGEQNEQYVIRAHTGTPGDTQVDTVDIDGTTYSVWVGKWSGNKPGGRLKMVYEGGEFPQSIRLKPIYDYWIANGHVSPTQYLLYMQAAFELHNAENGEWNARNINMWTP